MNVDDTALAELEERIAGKIAARRSLVGELKRTTGRWRDLRVELRDVSRKARRCRAEISECVGQLRGFGALRREVLGRIRLIQAKIAQAERVLHAFEGSAPRESERQVTRRLVQLEWKLQTERLTRGEEQLLVGYVKNLEAKLLAWKRAYVARQELMGLLEEIRGLKARLDEMNEVRERLEPEVEARREETARLDRAGMQLQREIKGVEGDVAELERKLAEADAELRELEAARATRLSAVAAARLAVLRDQARARVAKGQKLSFDELKVLYSDSADELLK